MTATGNADKRTPPTRARVSGADVIHGDCLDALAAMDEASVDAIVTDPPAAISFMSAKWDSDRGGRREWVAWLTTVMTECHRVLKPGGHAVVWALPRTSHWTAWAVEDAGFEIRDVVIHMFGSGFPKSLDVSAAIDKAAGAERETVATVPGRMPQAQAAGWGNPGVDTFRDERKGTVDYAITAPATDEARRWDGYGTALKPAHENWILARKPLAAGTVAGNVLAHGTGALNIDACRLSVGEPDGRTREREAEASNGRHYAEDSRDFHATPGPRGGSAAGRWPANVILDETAAQQLDASTGTLTSGGGLRRPKEWQSRNAYGFSERPNGASDYSRDADSGGASRYFYCAKASSTDRGDSNTHPTVKPVELMRWLIRLVTPPDGTIVDPFAGSGTTGVAAVIESRRCILIEREQEYVDIIHARLGQPIQPSLLGGVA